MNIHPCATCRLSSCAIFTCEHCGATHPDWGAPPPVDTTAEDLARAVEAEQAHRTITDEMTQEQADEIIFALDHCNYDDAVRDALRAYRARNPRRAP